MTHIRLSPEFHDIVTFPARDLLFILTAENIILDSVSHWALITSIVIWILTGLFGIVCVVIAVTSLTADNISDVLDTEHWGLVIELALAALYARFAWMQLLQWNLAAGTILQAVLAAGAVVSYRKHRAR